MDFVSLLAMNTVPRFNILRMGNDHTSGSRKGVFIIVISAYSKRKFVDYEMYSTAGILRTMELILGLPPMSQYDAAATPLFKCFSKNADVTAFQSVPASVNINERNVTLNTGKRRNYFDFSHEDAAPDAAFNEDFWKVMRGEKSKMPAPKRSAFVKIAPKSEEDDN